MTPVNAIEVVGVTKSFVRHSEPAKSLKERVLTLRRNTTTRFNALDDIRFDVPMGSSIGLLGHNGSGKSTLLKCIAGTIRPSSGSVRVRGRIAALLELGAGFHPDLTGRENVFLNGSILGFSRAQIERIFDDIVEFSELGPFVDSQVKHYSSGMYARLGFAVAVNVEPQILLIDEVLAVGDEAFQRKCLDRIDRFQHEGRTLLLVTHSPDLARQICDRVVVLDHGSQVFDGDPGEAAAVYRRSLAQRGEPVPESMDRPVRIAAPEIVDRIYAPGDSLELTAAFESDRMLRGARPRLFVHANDGALAATAEDLGTVDGTSGSIKLTIHDLPFMEGRYHATIALFDDDTELDRSAAHSFDVMTAGRGVGRFRLQVTVG